MMANGYRCNECGETRYTQEGGAAPDCSHCGSEDTGWLASFEGAAEPEGLTGEERLALAQLAGAWETFKHLDPPPIGEDAADFGRALHVCQRIVGFRVARRVDPEYWRKQ